MVHRRRFALLNLQTAGHAMVAMSLAYPGFSKQLASTPTASPTCFQPLDPGVVNASIPTFFVGRNRDGFWLARDARGENGGIFLFKGSALAFVRRASGQAGCATIFPSERFELDVENQGNPLIDYLMPLLRLAMTGWRRTVAATGRTARGTRH
jgi:hypothetical protein